MSRDAVCLAFLSLIGLSAGATPDDYGQRLYPFDTPGDVHGFLFGYPRHQPNPIRPQSSCTVTLLAGFLIAEVDGTLVFRGRTRDVLRCAQADGLVGASPELAREIGRQNGLLQEPTQADRPLIEPGTVLLIGGDDGLPFEKWTRGGVAHGLAVIEVEADGTLVTVEGGQTDEHNSGYPTAIKRCRREVYPRPGRGWWVRSAGDKGPGRQLQWWYQAGDLPCVPSGDA